MAEAAKANAASVTPGVFTAHEAMQLDLEEALREGLRKARSKWDSHDGDRQFWLTSCRDTDSLHELASLLLQYKASPYTRSKVLGVLPGGPPGYTPLEIAEANACAPVVDHALKLDAPELAFAMARSLASRFTDSCATIECGVPGGDKWSGIAACDGRLYCTPRDASSVLVIEPVTNTCSTIDCGTSGEHKWFGIAARGQHLCRGCCGSGRAAARVRGAAGIAAHRVRAVPAFQS